MKARTAIAALLPMLLASAGATQVVPGFPRVDPLGALREVADRAGDTLDRSGRALAATRLDRIRALVRSHPDRIVRDPQGFPARAGEVIVTDPGDTLIEAATARGITLLDRDNTLGVGYVRFGLPAGMSLKTGIALLHKLGAREVSADQLFQQSGTVTAASPPAVGHGVRVGMIDGGVASGTTTQRAFARGAPNDSDHGTAVASLLVGAKGIRGAAPGAQLLAADVYGTDPAGGNASAIVKALGWLVGERVAVVTVSLVGPPNPLLARVVAAAQARGTIIVAAVGNDGPAAPPSYPASYPGVIAVTAVDGRKRILIEAGRADHLDYAAPGADMIAATVKGTIPVRGTSFAAPLVAGTIALRYPTQDLTRRTAALAQVDASAERHGPRYGRGIVCGQCAAVAR